MIKPNGALGDAGELWIEVTGSLFPGSVDCKLPQSGFGTQGPFWLGCGVALQCRCRHLALQ